MKIEDYNKYYIQGSDHYLIPKDIFKELFNEMINWKEDAKKYKEVIDRASARLEYFLIGNLKYQSSQEEFIKLVNILKEVSK